LRLTHQELKSRVLETHKPIADQLIEGVGLDAQFLDSQIAETVMTSMMEDDIVVLPIHDSFIVRTGYQQWLEKTMQAAFKLIVGALVSVDAEGSRLVEHFGLTKGEFKQEENKKNNDPSVSLYSLANLDFDSLFKETLMRSYVGYWHQWKNK